MYNYTMIERADGDVATAFALSNIAEQIQERNKIEKRKLAFDIYVYNNQFKARGAYKEEEK